MAKAPNPDFTCLFCQRLEKKAVMQLRLDKKKLIFTSIVLFFIGFFSMLYDNSAFKMLKLKMLLNFFLKFQN